MPRTSSPEIGMTKSLHSTQSLKLREELTRSRNKAGLTQQVLADRLGRPQSFVAKYEVGERRLDVIEFLEVTRAIGIDPHTIIRAIEKK